VIFYTLYIEDDRYRVPTLLSVELADDIEALAYMAKLFSKSEHYQAMEIWEGDRQVTRSDRSAAMPE
jgi:hypothetical protein